MLDIGLLRIIKHRQEYNKIRSIIPMDTLDEKTRVLVEDFGKYFKKYETHPVIDLTVFIPQFKHWHKDWNAETITAYMPVFKTMMKDYDDTTRIELVGNLHELALAGRIGLINSMYVGGTLDVPLHIAISAAYDDYRIAMGVKDVDWDNTPIEDLLQEDLDDSGLRWRIDSLNRSMRGLRPGDFGIVAGRPDRGKTTMLTSEISYMAPQLPSDKNVLWLNNEGPSGRIVKRIWQSALNLTVSEMVRLSEQGRLRDSYEESVGRLDRIRVVNVHNMHVGQVEEIIDNSNPGIIVYDMIDKIRGFQSEARTDLVLEQMYDWGRNTAVKYGCVGLATSQISNEGDGLQWPTLGMLKDSKTGKQGACDFQLMIGALNDPEMNCYRYISLPKNKCRREGNPADPRATVIFDAERGRYNENPEVIE